MNKLKVGYLSLAKGSWINDQRKGEQQKALKVLSIAGKGIDTPQMLRGTPLNVRFKRPAVNLVKKS
jgi:hypothetical protein